MNPAQLPLHLQLARLREVLSTNTTLIAVLTCAASLRLPDWYLAAGSVSQTIWNHVSGIPPETGIHDYDLIYHNPSDLSYEAEDAIIQASKAKFDKILQRPMNNNNSPDAGTSSKIEVEIRNQARVHLWYEKRFGVPCAPHSSSEAAIDTWVTTSAQIGIRLEDDGTWSVYAPRGLSDLFNMVVRPVPMLGTQRAYEDKISRWRQIWPALKVDPWPEEQETRQ